MATPPKTKTGSSGSTAKTPEIPGNYLLDEFAMAALTGAVSGKNLEGITIHHMQKLAEACYLVAEAMLEEREKHG